MGNNDISMLDVLIQTHKDLERQGPGSAEMVIKALSFVDNHISRAADLCCGTGGQTMTLARNIPGTIVGVDQIPDFINVLNDNAKQQNLGDRLSGIVGDALNLPFQKEEFDLIWSEGAIDSIGFEKGLAYWFDFLKKDGCIAVTCPSWLTDERPSVADKFWKDAGIELDTVADNITIMQKCGYSFIASFVLPEECWTEGYFRPRWVKEQLFSEKYAGNKAVEEYIRGSEYEAELYSKYKKHYGYVFYIRKSEGKAK